MLGLVCASFFYRLGAPVLFEPDEGRNAEKAREILVLNDWVTPHNNFYPVLDKPMFFYWLIALAYKTLGVSETAARLPSALSALLCLAAVYVFVRRWWGEWEARWSVLTLATSAGFFIYARIVIFDIALTACVTISLCAFYQALQSPERRAGWPLCVLLYTALGAATLIKGLVGIIVPGMVMFFFLLLTRGWRCLPKVRLLPGILLFLVIVTPWYALAEIDNPGYLKYFFWDEHFGRFATGEFERRNVWYYYLYVVPLGLLPWTCLAPSAVRHYWHEPRDTKTLWLFLWAALPVLFFSLSKAKLPHYILPSLPPLAILLGAAVSRALNGAPAQLRFGFAAGWLLVGSVFVYTIAGLIHPPWLPRIIRGALDGLAPWFWLTGLVSATLALLAWRRTTWMARHRGRIFAAQAGGLLLLVLTLGEMMTRIAPLRSAAAIAAQARPLLTPATQMVSYDTYLEGLQFYLGAERPLWMVTNRNKKKTFLGNFYAVAKRPEPATHWGEALLEYDEFTERWHGANQPLLVLIKEKNLRGFEQRVGGPAKQLAASGDYLLITRPMDFRRAITDDRPKGAP